MRKYIHIFTIILATICTTAGATTTRSGLRTSTTTTTRAATSSANSATPIAAYNYNYMYPYLNNQMRTDLNPGVTPSQSGNPISVITKTEKLSAPRAVVPRGTTGATNRAATTSGQSVARAPSNTVRASVPQSNQQITTARSSVTPQAVSAQTSNRGVVSRTAARTNRTDASVINRAATNNVVTTTGDPVTSARCLADYTECMNRYCQRENTKYNRCYCSAKLAQIDAQYQPAIDSLIRQILTLQSNNAYSDAEMNEYWMATIGKYTGTNSWENIDAALDINWADTESRVRGQQAFVTGHEYCVQHTRGCFYMAANLRDAYRSEISRDCATYESGLAKIKNAAESIVESYND